MDKFLIDERANASFELKRLFEYNSIAYTSNEDESIFEVVFADQGVKWITRFCCEDSIVTIYGLYPFSVEKEESKLYAFCTGANKQLIMGAFIYDEEEQRLVMRTGAELFDAYSAYEVIARLIEYNTGAMVRFWDEAIEASGCNQI